MQRIVMTALLAGALAGIAVFALHMWQTTPMILEAEVFENGTPAPAHASIVPLSFEATQNNGTGSGGANEYRGLQESPKPSSARTIPEFPTMASQLPLPMPHALMSGVPDDTRRNVPQVRTSVSAMVPSRPTEHKTRPSSMKLVEPTIEFGCKGSSTMSSPNRPLDPSP